MPLFEGLERASFDEIVFPVKSVRIKGALRDHVHVYPHSPGGAPEKMGRALYEIEMQAMFLGNLPAYENLWPASLSALRNRWEGELTADLSIPTLGRIRAYAVSWQQSTEAINRSGEMVQLVFREDASDQFLQQALLKVDQGAIDSALSNFEVTVREFDPQPDIFGQITDAVNDVLAFRDQFELFGNLVESKIRFAIALIKEADRTVDLLQDPVNHEEVSALHELWLASVELAENAAGLDRELREFIVVFDMSVSEISQRIYGSTDRATDIMQLNGLEDPFAVPAGTKIRYYEQEDRGDIL